LAGVEVASLYGTLKLENTASDALKQFKGDMGEAHGGLMDIAKGALGLGGILTAALGGIGFGAMIHEAAEAEKGMAQLNAVLKSTHGVAGVTSDMATDLANSLSKVTAYSDDAVLGAENILLTFTNIKADVFPGVTEMALNMSQALGQDVKSSAMQLGKALNDPINGATALRTTYFDALSSVSALPRKMRADSERDSSFAPRSTYCAASRFHAAISFSSRHVTFAHVAPAFALSKSPGICALVELYGHLLHAPASGTRSASVSLKGTPARGRTTSARSFSRISSAL
jgi:hypothetical protein